MDVLVPAETLRHLILAANHADYVTAATTDSRQRKPLVEAVREATTAYYNVTGDDLETATPHFWKGGVRVDRRRRHLGVRPST